jgi:hypothetical protein
VLLSETIAVNMIVEKSKHVEWYTNLDEVFRRIDEFRAYYWIISDLKLNCPDSRLETDPVVIDGDALNQIIQGTKVQFIWGVLSGFRDRIECVPKDLPYADGNRELWVGSPKPQVPNAAVEIVCWDSTCTLFIGVGDSVAAKLKEIYPDIRDLDDENRRRPQHPAPIP